MTLYALDTLLDKLTLRVVDYNVAAKEIETWADGETLLATRSTLVLSLRRVKGKMPWIIGLELDSKKVVAVPSWYFKEIVS